MCGPPSSPDCTGAAAGAKGPHGRVRGGGRAQACYDGATTLRGRTKMKWSLLAVAAVIMGGKPALAQKPPGFSKIQVKTTDLGNRTYMLEGAGRKVTVPGGHDEIVMDDSALPPTHHK